MSVSRSTGGQHKVQVYGRHAVSSTTHNSFTFGPTTMPSRFSMSFHARILLAEDKAISRVRLFLCVRGEIFHNTYRCSSSVASEKSATLMAFESKYLCRSTVSEDNQLDEHIDAKWVQKLYDVTYNRPLRRG